MIDFINIKNFKSLLDNSFPLGPLNLFSGLNGMGKSTLIQCLLLLRQSNEKNWLKTRGLLLNDENHIELGTGKDVFSSFAVQDKINFTIEWSDHSKPTTFEFDYKPDSDLLPHSGTGPDEQFEDLSLFYSNFQYLCAERLGPQSIHKMSEFHVRELKSLGKRGEYTAHYIATHGDKYLNIIEL